jgi:hypothetical protein
MTIKMEVKKHKLEQLQSGEWKLTLTVHNDDMSMELVQAAMGHPYMAVMEAIDYDNPVEKPVEQTEGEKLRTRAVMLCKEDEQFQDFCHDYMVTEGGREKYGYNESYAKNAVYIYCGTDSLGMIPKSEKVRNKFKEMLEHFNQWKTEQKYPDNCSR